MMFIILLIIMFLYLLNKRYSWTAKELIATAGDFYLFFRHSSFTAKKKKKSVKGS